MHILIIDDSKTIAHIMMATLQAYGFTVDCYNSKQLNENLYDLSPYRLYLINTSLNNFDPLELIKDLRRRYSDKYILGINSKGDWKQRVKFLNRGADDVLSYPFPMQEMLARIQALLRRSSAHKIRRYKLGDLVVDSTVQNAYLFDQPLELKRKEYRLLEYLIENENRPVSRSELLDNVWDYRKVNGSNTIDVHINRLRRNKGIEGYIKTVYGFGYKLQDPKLPEEVDTTKQIPDLK
ncbi:MAG: response regulator transcription factor [Candidatus Dojkabacteria bacterium]